MPGENAISKESLTDSARETSCDCLDSLTNLAPSASLPGGLFHGAKMNIQVLQVWDRDNSRWNVTMHSSRDKASKAHTEAKKLLSYDRSKANGITEHAVEGGKAGLIEWFNMQRFALMGDS